jgi:hypothetical protein
LTEGETIKHIARESEKRDKKVASTNDESVSTNSGDETIPAYSESERKLKYLDTLKRKREIQLLQIKEEKIRGEVVPSALISPLLLQHNTSIIHSFKNAAEQITSSFGHKHGLKQADVVVMRSEIVKLTNEAIQRATAITVAAVKGIIDDYALSRAQGEKK